MSKQIIIPQAHSYAFFEDMFLEMQNKNLDQNALAKQFDVQPRTISYYIQLARWIAFLKDDILSEAGKTFINAEKKERVAFFKEALKKIDWVEAAIQTDGTTDAFDQEIAKVSTLADATRRRRARAMSKLWISVLEADGTIKKTKPKKKKRVVKKKTSSTKKETAAKTSKKITSPEKKTSKKKKVKKKTVVKKKAATKKAAPKTPEKKTTSKKLKKKSAAPKKKTSASKTPSKAAKKNVKKETKTPKKKKTEYKYNVPAAKRAPDHPLLWAGKKVVKSVFKVAGIVLRRF